MLTGLPLGSPRQHSPAVMVNLLGDIWPLDNDAGTEPDWQSVFSNPELKMHLYGKKSARTGRKMGHLTLLNVSLDDAIEQAMQVRTDLHIGE